MPLVTRPNHNPNQNPQAKIVRNRDDRRNNLPVRKIVKFDPALKGMEVEHNDFQMLKAHNMSPGQQSRVLEGKNPGPMGEVRPSAQRNKEE